MISKRLVATAAVAALALGACADDDDADTATDGAAATTDAAAGTTEATATSDAPGPTDTTGAANAGPTAEATTDLSSLSGEIVVSGSSTVEPISIAAGNA